MCVSYLYKAVCVYTQLICVSGNKRVQSSIRGQLGGSLSLQHQLLPSPFLLFFHPPPLFLLFPFPFFFLLFSLPLPLLLLLSPSSLLFLCFLLGCSEASLCLPILLLPLSGLLLLQEPPLTRLLFLLLPLLLLSSLFL